MTTLPVVLAVLVAGLSLTACDGQVVCEESPCGDSAAATSTEGAGGSAGSGQGSDGGGSPTGSGHGGDGGGGSAHAPVEGVACNFESPVWMGYVISAENMASGASNASGEGRCEGWVSFEPETFSFSMWDAATETSVQGTANGSTWYEDCGTPHCGTLTYGDGSITEQYCTVFALCDNGIAHSVGFTW